MLQEPKELIDVGEIGNQSTGDILFDGGNKINNVINALYNNFADYRLTKVNNGIGSAILHATGYYQKHPRNYYTQPIDIGSMHDVSVIDGTITVRLPKAKLGEGVVVTNMDGSVSEKLNIVITPNTSDIIGTATGNIIVTKPFTKVILWCVNIEGSKGTWMHKYESLFGDTTIALEGTYNIDSPRNISIAHKSEYNAIKFIINSNTETDFKTSEVLIHINHYNNTISHTEYGVIKSDNELYKVDFLIDSKDYINIRIEPTKSQRLSIKTIESIKTGVAL